MSSGAGRAHAQVTPAPIGIFTGHTDIGTVLHPGSVQYDAAKQTYTISGSGENVWFAADAFQFVGKKVEGDFTLTADISILGQGGDPHRKAMLMARQSLDPDSAYADVALHGVGLTSLQSREAKGEVTHEVQANVNAPRRVRLQKHGDEFSLWIAGEDGKFSFSGAAMRVPMKGEFYVGLGVCAHNKDAVETARFRNVAFGNVSSERDAQFYTTLETVDIASTDRRVTYVSSSRNAEIITAPNWTPDGGSLLFTYGGAIERVPVSGGAPKVVDTEAGYVTDAHGISPDGTMLAFSSYGCGFGDYSTIYVVPVGGGAPRRVTAKSPAFWRGWSPDGKTIVFLLTEGPDQIGIYTMPVAGGKETRLASGNTAMISGSAGFSPDGKYIYFNSDRSGAMEVWRMRPDGSQQEQLTKDGAGNWCPHVSPDGRLLAFLTQERRSARDLGLAPVTLRVMTLADGYVRVVAKFTGSNNSMPAPSWSPDSRRLAFMSYQGVGADTERPRMFVPKKIVK